MMIVAATQARDTRHAGGVCLSLCLSVIPGPGHTSKQTDNQRKETYSYCTSGWLAPAIRLILAQKGRKFRASIFTIFGLCGVCA